MSENNEKSKPKMTFSVCLYCPANKPKLRHLVYCHLRHTKKQILSFGKLKPANSAFLSNQNNCQLINYFSCTSHKQQHPLLLYLLLRFDFQRWWQNTTQTLLNNLVERKRWCFGCMFFTLVTYHNDRSTVLNLRSVHTCINIIV